MQIRDPIHNFVTIPDEFALVVNSGVLQRLRGIKQLALASLVYPGALHTRFDHTLGVTHVAGLMGERLKLEPDEIRLVQLAALLHDIGHGPFSHVSEASLRRFADPNTLTAGQNPHKIHEIVTASIIRTNPQLAEAGAWKDDKEREAVLRLLGGQQERRPVLKQLVSGPLDADKQDYLLRDSHFCGVSYGTFDLHQLQRSLRVVPITENDHELMIDPDGVHAVEQFVLAKYYMTSNVYRHRVRLITDAMIGRAIQLGIEKDRIEPMERLYRFDNSDAFVANYLLWDDARFWETFCPFGQKPMGELSGALLTKLRTRTLLKQVFTDSISTWHARIRDQFPDFTDKKSDALRTRIEAMIADFLTKQLSLQRTSQIDADYVILHNYTNKSVRETAKNEQAAVLVDDGLTPRSFHDASALFRSIDEASAEKFVEVYAPITWPDPMKKDVLRDEWKVEIRTMIEKECLANRSGAKS